MSEHHREYMAAFRAIDQTRLLDEGWNFGRGGHSSNLARQNARLLVTLYMAAGALTSIFPDSDGGIMVTGYKDDESFEILALSDGGFELEFETPTGCAAIVHLSNFNEIRDQLESRGWLLRNSSASFLQSIMIGGSAATSGSRLKTHLVEAFPSSNWIVPSIKVVESANTHMHSIRDSYTGLQPLFGGLIPQNFQRVPA